MRSCRRTTLLKIDREAGTREAEEGQRGRGVREVGGEGVRVRA